jgi:hypothetical protein
MLNLEREKFMNPACPCGSDGGARSRLRRTAGYIVKTTPNLAS